MGYGTTLYLHTYFYVNISIQYKAIDLTIVTIKIVLWKFGSFFNITYLNQLKIIPSESCRNSLRIEVLQAFVWKSFKFFGNFLISRSSQKSGKSMLCVILQCTHTPNFRSITQSSTKLWPKRCFVHLLQSVGQLE